MSHSVTPPDSANVRLDDVGATVRDQNFEAVLRVHVPARGDGNVDRGQSGDVIGEHRLLEPAHVVLRHAAREADGLLGIEAVVGVDVDLDAIAYRLTNRCSRRKSSASARPKSLATFVFTRGMPRST